jgi:predicted exporter
MIRSRAVIAAWLLLLVAAFGVITQTRFSADLSAFLPRLPTPAQQLLVDQLRDGVVSRLLLAGLSGAPPDKLAQASRALATRLRAESRFAGVDNGEDTDSARDRALVFRHRYLLSPAVDARHFSTPALRTALEASLELLNSPAGLLAKPLVPADPTGEVLLLAERMGGAGRPASHEGVWVNAAATEALLVLRTRAAGFDIDAQEGALATVHAAFAAVKRDLETPGLELELTGPGMFAVRTRAAIQRDATRFSLLATTLVAGLLLVTFRSPRVLVLGLLPILTGAAAGIAAVSLAFGDVHGITLGFGATLIGEAVDYAIYLFMQTDPARGARGTLARIWPTLRLGVLTSICGFSAMLLSGFPGLAQLGLFSIAGLVAAVLVTRFVLPLLLPEGFAITGVEAAGARAHAVFDGLRRWRPLVGLAVLGAVAVLIAREHPWSDELSSLSPVSLADQVRDQRLRGALGAPDVRHLVVVQAGTEDQALVLAERAGTVLEVAQGEDWLSGYETPAAALPSLAAQTRRRESLPDSGILRARLAEAMEGLPFRPGTFEPFVAAVAQARTTPLLDRTMLAGTRLAARVDALLVRRGDAWFAMLPLAGLTDPARLASALAALGDARVVLLDTKAESDALYAGYRREALWFSLAGAVAIVALLALTLRTPRRVLAVCAPLAAAVLVTTGAILLIVPMLTIFHLVGLLLVVAVGSNYALFFDRALSGGANERTALSLALANTTTVIGFGMLAFSSVPVLSAIGSTVGIGAFLSLLFAAALAPREAQA